MGTAHAEHNERVCDHLHTLNDFYDWVVTTAFYTALHYAEGTLFPTIGTTAYLDFESYYEKNKETLQCSKHIALHQLLRAKLPIASNAYKGLMDSCFNARYKNYQITPAEAKTARERMAFVKKECLK